MVVSKLTSVFLDRLGNREEFGDKALIQRIVHIFAVGHHAKTDGRSTEGQVLLAERGGVLENILGLGVREGADKSVLLQLLGKPFALKIARAGHLYRGVADIGNSFQRLGEGVEILRKGADSIHLST